MRRNVLIAKCAAGEIEPEKYEELCAQYPWLRQNVEQIKQRGSTTNTYTGMPNAHDPGTAGNTAHTTHAAQDNDIEIKTTRRYKRQGDR